MTCKRHELVILCFLECTRRKKFITLNVRNLNYCYETTILCSMTQITTQLEEVHVRERLDGFGLTLDFVGVACLGLSGRAFQ